MFAMVHVSVCTPGFKFMGLFESLYVDLSLSAFVGLPRSETVSVCLFRIYF